MSLRKFLRGFKSGFQNFSHSIGYAVSTVVLTLTYILGVGIVFIASKIARKKFLPVEKKESYWFERNLGKQTIEEHKRSF